MRDLGADAFLLCVILRGHRSPRERSEFIAGEPTLRIEPAGMADRLNLLDG